MGPMSAGLEYRMFFDELFTKPIIQKIRKELENSPEEALRKIVKDYESATLYKKFVRRLFFYGPAFYETNLKYLFARDTLRGTFSFKKLDKEQRKKEQEREKELLEEKLNEELIKERRNIELFPGSLREYEILKKRKYQIVDSGKQDKNMYYDFGYETYLTLGKLGIEALIRCQLIYKSVGFGGESILTRAAGIPVKRVEKSKNNP